MYDAMRIALQDCVNLDEVVDLRNRAIALEEYARRATDKEPLQWVNEIRMRAERKVGELLHEMVKHGGDRRSNCQAGNLKPTLARLGISGGHSSRWQRLASVSPERFEKGISTMKALGKGLSTSSVMRELGLESNLKSRGKYAKPLAGARGKAVHAALDAAAQTNTSMLLVYARLMLRELRAKTDFNPEEYALLDELRDALHQRKVNS